MGSKASKKGKSKKKRALQTENERLKPAEKCIDKILLRDCIKICKIGFRVSVSIN